MYLMVRISRRAQQSCASIVTGTMARASPRPGAIVERFLQTENRGRHKSAGTSPPSHARDYALISKSPLPNLRAKVSRASLTPTCRGRPLK